MKPLAPNTLLQNRYLIVHLIGKGGMGEVYLAVDQRLGSAVALKRTLHGDDSQLGEAFEREARTLARLRHPALPKVSDHFIENGNQFLVMEHISGDDLASRLKTTGKPFPLSWVLYWADQLLDALAYLHSHEPPIIHRDIKPQNLKLTDDNNIVLLDFGLSKNTTGATGALSGGGSGSTGSVVGYTPHYAPMEQIRGTGTNPRSDIYSLSATLYQLLTNVVPPDALSRADFLLSGKTDPIAPINEVNHEIPKAISDVVLRGMSISQDQRFADARQMQKVLRETYARLQSEAADKTLAFNVQDDAPVIENAVIVETPATPAPPPVAAEPPGAKTIPFGMKTDAAVSETPPAAAPVANFDATLRMDGPPPTFGDAPPSSTADRAPRQAEIKTEVFGADFGAAAYLDSQPSAPASSATGGPPTPTPATPTPAPPEPTGERTVPLIRFDAAPADFDPAQTQPAAAFEAAVVSPAPDFGTNSPENGAAESAAPESGAAAAFAAESAAAFAAGSAPGLVTADAAPAASGSPPVSRPPAAGKRSKGFLIGILAGLFALGVLAVGAVGGVLYYLNQTSTPPVTDFSTPTPVTPATPPPTPETANTSANGADNTAVGGSTDDPDNANTAGNTDAPGNANAVNERPDAPPTPPSGGVTPRPGATTAPTARPQTGPTRQPGGTTTVQPTKPKPGPKPEAKPEQRPRGGMIPQ